MDLIIASNNEFKIREIKDILGVKFKNIYSLKDRGIDLEVEENGDTFYENALIKARETSFVANIPSIADDSGLCVRALNDAPGVYSARFAGYPCDDNLNNMMLLDRLRPHDDRSAYFKSVIVLYDNGKIVTGEGVIEGEILYEEKGTGGFGYDPLFYCYELGKTFAQATPEEKNRVSHRARALADLISKL